MVRAPLRSRAAAVAYIFVALTALSGCGFTPLYANHEGGQSSRVVDAMSKVIIRSLPDRDGQKLHQVLREQLQPQGMDAHPLYDLDVTLTTRVEELGIRKDATSSRANLNLSASFYLSEGGQHVYGDRVQSIVSYNILDDQYATVAAQADAENRALRQIGEAIKTRLAVFLEDHTKPKPVASAAH